MLDRLSVVHPCVHTMYISCTLSSINRCMKKQLCKHLGHLISFGVQIDKKSYLLYFKVYIIFTNIKSTESSQIVYSVNFYKIQIVTVHTCLDQLSLQQHSPRQLLMQPVQQEIVRSHMVMCFSNNKQIYPYAYCAS